MTTAGIENDEPRLRSESDLEVERKVHSIIDQINKETSWQYHLTTTEFDDALPSTPDHASSVGVESDCSKGYLGQINKGIEDHVNSDSAHLNEMEEAKTSFSNSMGDVNSNEIGNMSTNSYAQTNESQGIL